MKRRYIYLVVLLLFSAYLFKADYIFNTLIKTTDEARLIELNLPIQTQKIKFHIDKTENIKLQWKEGISLHGWVFKENVKNNNREVYLVLKSESETLIFDITRDTIERKGVEKKFSLNGIYNHGFELKFASYLLNAKDYRIGFLIEDNSGKFYTLSEHILAYEKGNYSVIKPVKLNVAGKSNIQAFSSKNVKIKMKESTIKLNFNFDNITKSTNQIDIKGWAFLEGFNTDLQKTYILLKKDEKEVIYETNVKLRKDVSNHYNKMKLSLDHSGFVSSIPLNNLAKGKYQLGLYTENEENASKLYSGKYIEIK